MQLTSLRLTNFRQHAHTVLELGPGLLAIVGANGSGKTTLLEAIAWALYGTAAARGVRDTIKRRGAQPRDRVEVELVFQLGRHQYHLTRTLTNAELQQDGEVIANSATTVTERVASLLGMSREEFFNTYFTGQRQLAVMAAMTPAERGRFLSRVLGYEKLRTAQERLRADRSARRAELSGLEQGLADPAELKAAVVAATTQLDQARRARDAAVADRATAAAAVAALEPEWQRLREQRVAWQGLDGERRVAEGRVLAAQTAFQALDRELAAAVAAERELVGLADRLTDWSALLAEREALDQAAAAVAARSPVVARRDAALERVAAVEAELAALPTPELVAERRAALTAAVAARDLTTTRHAERFTRWKQDEQEARTKLEQYRDRYRELREQHQAISEAGPDGVCPFCARPLGADHDHTLAVLAAQMDEVEASGNYYRKRVDQLASPPPDMAELERERLAHDVAVGECTEALATAEGGATRRTPLARERDGLRLTIDQAATELTGPAAQYDPTRHEAIRGRIADLEPVRRQHDQVAGVAARAVTLVVDAQQAEQVASAAEAILAALDQRVAALGWSTATYEDCERRVGAATTALQVTEVRAVSAGDAVDVALTRHGEAAARLADRAARAEAVRRLNTTIERLNALDEAFSDLRRDLNAELRPELQARAAGFLSDLTDGRYADVEITEDYQAAIIEGAEVKPVISGGEEDVLNLALRLAISQMIADRAGQPLSLLVLDEIFGSLDDARRQSVLELLRAIGDRFPQVIVITHVEGLSDAFDRVLRVSHDVERGVTTVRDAQEPLGVAS
jgi:exonuclease SbcC